MDTRRKLTYYIHPEDFKGDKLLCDKLSSLEKSEKSRLLRAATIAGFALFRQDERIPHLLTALLDENTTMAEIIQVISSVKPDALGAGSVERHEVVQTLLESILVHVANLKSEAVVKDAAPPRAPEFDAESEETRRNALNMFHQPISKS
ncbi:plasmid partitioning/stability family protein [Pantoea sp. ACRSB]|uniref:plasmid partitioning/stability family protein n=1 Tax=Pantoea sp. ACRSB TaxID=2918207 RepID=UPI002893782F|nr:plasmid partitioning/stability family protein [Pantoea sp. ACRSB]MCG7391157.1 plasmid partitioning/stability family protein [Pantoea sp. ACRSB]